MSERKTFFTVGLRSGHAWPSLLDRGSMPVPAPPGAERVPVRAPLGRSPKRLPPPFGPVFHRNARRKRVQETVATLRPARAGERPQLPEQATRSPCGPARGRRRLTQTDPWSPSRPLGGGTERRNETTLETASAPTGFERSSSGVAPTQGRRSLGIPTDAEGSGRPDLTRQNPREDRALSRGNTRRTQRTRPAEQGPEIAPSLDGGR